MPELRIYLLGALDIRYDGQPLPKPPTLKSQSLLAYLLLHRSQPQPRERLTALFWGDRPEPKARHSLATALWHIRRCLPPPPAGAAEDYILSDPHKLQFDPRAALWLDVDTFEALISQAQSAENAPALLSAAAALYRGDFLDGFYDDWIVAERYRLAGLFSQALARWMAFQEESGDHESALSTALRLLQHDPLREDAHRLAMRAYCRLGQRNLALEQHRRCQAAVRSGLGAEPMAETSALYQAILEGRFADVRASTPAQAALVQPAAPSGRNPLDALAPSRLVGREREMEFLLAAWACAAQGSGNLALILGEAGVGKTRLAEEFASRLRAQGVRLLWGRCYEFERLLPYHPLSEALRAALPCLSQADLAGVPSWAVCEVARLAPELAHLCPDLQTPELVDPILEQTRLCDGVAEFLRQLSARQPLLLVVEDLHWASESSLQMLHYLARRLGGRPPGPPGGQPGRQPLLLLGTACEEALGERHPLRLLLRRLGQEGLGCSLRLPRLSLPAIQTIVAEMSAAPEAVAPLAERLYRETEGNPFYLMEIIKALFETGLLHLSREGWSGDFARISQAELALPASLSEALQARIDALDDPAREVLRLAAVLGAEFDFDPLNALWGRGEQATLEALDVLLRHRLLEEGSGPLGRDYAFGHHKLQQVVYAGLRGRRLLHRRAGEILERLQPGGLPDEALALAWHFERAAEPGKAARYALQVGLAAKAVFAHDEARRHFDRALLLLEQEAPRLRAPADIAANLRLRIQAFNERGWALRLLGDMHTYDRDLEQVAGLARSLGDPRTLAHLRWREATTHRWFCRYAQARQAAEAGARLGQEAADASLEALCLREVGMAARAVGDYAGALAALERALSLFAELGDAVFEIHVLCNLSTLCWCTAEYPRALHFARQALARCEQDGLAFERRLPLGDLGAAAAAVADLPLARQTLLESLSIARQIADRTQEIFCLGHLGWLCMRERDADQALERLQEALALAQAIDSRNEQSWLLSGLAEARRLLGDLRQAAALARQALQLAEAQGRAYDQGLARQVLARLGETDP
ncbi:MAG: AAA family ATPase [Anaerolineales bacterium]|nr:AAA family ATPase [Anaerolineales bacterium]